MVYRKRKRDDDPYPIATDMPSTSQAGSSSIPNVVESPPKVKAKPPAKRQRKVKDSDAPAPEKRDARFKSACPKNTLDRVDRVMSQRFFMVDRTRNGQELREEFSVLGSTGNVYTVMIDKRPTCSCPDAMKGNHCKHILFVFLKVLQVSRNSTHWYQKALLSTELEEIFADAPLAPNSVLHPRLRDAYACATGNATASSSSSNDTGTKQRLPGPDDDCPICYEGMHGVATSNLTFCTTCGNALHKECFQQWARTASIVTCVWCRAKWPATGDSSTGARPTGGYINLADVAGVSPVRDTSSYHRRGQHY